jgi:DNA repair protein RecN (Recombination protein N)
MIRHLYLKNVFLIESCRIDFEPGFTILSGETGSGKTALIQALALALGQRADSSCIRKGETQALIEAAFDIEHLQSVKELLEEAGIAHDAGEYLIIRREISSQGKNRAFLGSQMAPLPLIQQIGNKLIHLIGQHSYPQLKTSEAQIQILDLFADVSLLPFQSAWAQEKALRDKLEEQKSLNAKKERELDTYRTQWQELEEANPQEGEEEKLFADYQRLSSSQELKEKIGTLHQGLLSFPLPRYKNTCDSLSAIDPALKEPATLLQEAHIALQETHHLLSSYLDRLEHDPKHFLHLEERLTLLNRLKRKYGDPHAYKKELQEKLHSLENLDEEVEKTSRDLKEAENKTSTHCSALTKKRKTAAAQLAKTLTTALQTLNMPGAELTIEILSQPRCRTGVDLIHFWLKANKGESPVLVKESASGGELSRLLLAIKTTLAEKNDTPTIVFDEIDANVGGTTATLIGQQLHTLGTCRQVICITHFPQVASQADHHLCVHKQEQKGRTLTTIHPLNKQERTQELERMSGKKILRGA